MIEENQFSIPEWIKKGALTKNMFEHTFYLAKDKRKLEVFEGSKSLVNIVDLIFEEPLDKLEKQLLELDKNISPQKSNEVGQKFFKLNDCYQTINSTLKKYHDIALAGFDYENRGRKDSEDNGYVVDKKIRLFYKGQNSRVDNHYNKENLKTPSYTTVTSLLNHVLSFSVALTRNKDIEELPSYNEFLIIANQISAAHAVIYYANEIENIHIETIKRINNNKHLAVSNICRLIDKEFYLYEKAIKQIKYDWDIIKYNLVLAVDEKAPVKLSHFKEEPVVIDYDHQLDKNYNTKSLYQKTLSKIGIIKSKVLTNKNTKEL